jgi:hypothetical protein
MTPLETQLYEALLEARGWNWLDDDMPPEVVTQVDAATSEYYRQLEQEQPKAPY